MKILDNQFKTATEKDTNVGSSGSDTEGKKTILNNCLVSVSLKETQTFRACYINP